VLEFNASDVRGKVAIEELAAGAATTRGLFAKKTCLVMDEVDGVSDRGGNAALIQLIKKTKIPVICICNDRMDQKVRSLANSCLDIRFTRPSRADVVRRVLVVMQLEAANAPGLRGLQESEIAELAESVGCDVRQVLNTLQLRSQQPISDSASTKSWGKIKDAELMQTPFEVTKILLTSSMARNFSFNERLELAFVDYDLIPLLIQQNYVRCVDKVSQDRRAMEAVAKASKFIAYADRISNQLRSSNDWSLLPDFVMMSSVAPAFACNNLLAFPEFPAYLGKLSTTNKNIRLAREFKTMMGQRISSREVAKSGLVEVVYRRVMAEIKSGNIESVVALFNELEIPKDALTEHMTELRCLPAQIDEYKDVDSKVKAALTRAYNASAQRLRVPPADFAATKRSGGRNGDEDDEMLEDGDGEGSEQEEQKTVGGLIKQAKPKAAAKASAKAKAKAKASSAK
jgi:replication factor C subunit 1